MLKKGLIAGIAAVIILGAAASLALSQGKDGGKWAMSRKGFQGDERNWGQYSYRMNWNGYGGRFGTPRAPIDRRWGPGAVERRFEGTMPFQPGEYPRRPNRPFIQKFNSWFDGLKTAYREGDREKVGLQIRKMEQFRQRAGQRMESMRVERPFVPERFRERPLPEWGPLNDRQMEPGRPAEGMREGRQRPPFERDGRYGFGERMRPEGMPNKFDMKRPLPGPRQEYCENCTCPNCTKIREQLQQQKMHQRLPEGATVEKAREMNQDRFDWDY
jgi:hypothetical protein